MLILFAIISLLTILVWMRHYSAFWKHIMAIPGPKYYPVIGNLRDIWHDSETLFRTDRIRCKEFYPIFKIWIFNGSAVCLMNPHDIEIILSSPKHIGKGMIYDLLHNWLGKGLLTSTGSKWQTRRKILTPAFHFSILQQFIHIFNKETNNLVEVLTKECHKPYIDVVRPVTEFTLYSIGETSMGVNLNERSESASYKDAVYKFGQILTKRIVRPWLYNKNIYSLTSLSKKEDKSVKIMHDFSTKIIEERKRIFNVDKGMSYSTRKRLAMLDLLLKAKDEGADIDDNGIREEVDTFMFEGHDTAAMAICYIFMALANEKSIQEEVRREIYEILGDSDEPPSFKELTEMKYMERCIKESLRLYPSVPFIARLAEEDIKTHSGYTIPKGSDINIYIFDLHRAPQVWENPEKFDPDRFLPDNVSKRHPFAYLPFSAGPRNCIGQRFAILEIKAVLCGILRKFQLEAVSTPEDLRYKTDVILRPYDEIRVKFVPR